MAVEAINPGRLGVEIQNIYDRWHEMKIDGYADEEAEIHSQIQLMIDVLSRLNKEMREMPKDETIDLRGMGLEELRDLFENSRVNYWDENPIPEDLEIISYDGLERMIQNIEQLRTIKQGEPNRIARKMYESGELLHIISKITTEMVKQSKELIDRIQRRTIVAG